MLKVSSHLMCLAKHKVHNWYLSIKGLMLRHPPVVAPHEKYILLATPFPTELIT